MADAISGHWSRSRERGSALGLRFTVACYRYLGHWLTLPLIHFLREGDPAARAAIREILAAGRGGDEVAQVRTALESTGSLDFARDRARSYVADALGRLDVLPETSARGALRALADYVLERRR